MTTQVDLEELWYLEQNSSAPTTIVLIHGFLSCHLEWDYVTPYLTDYHLLAIDSAGHSKSSHLLPATIPAASDRIAALIRTRAHNGHAHVVGLSMGGSIALNLAARYPSLILSAFVSGAAPLEGNARWMSTYPSIIWYFSHLMNIMPESVFLWQQGLLPHKELYREILKNKTRVLMNDVCLSLAERGWDDVRAMRGVRTLAIAGAKKDPVDDVKKFGIVWKENGQSMNRAVMVEDAVHVWNMQLPELFAQAIIAWVEEKPLPKELVEL